MRVYQRVCVGEGCLRVSKGLYVCMDVCVYRDTYLIRKECDFTRSG